MSKPIAQSNRFTCYYCTMPNLIIWIYIAVSAANVIAQIIPSEDLDRFTKPLLMPLLLFYVYQKSVGNTTLKVLLLSAAILFSWFGDLALMYQSEQMYFILGIALFLISQIFYIATLRRATYQSPKITLLTVLPFVIYGAALFYVLLPAGDFTIPMVAYGVIILLMTVSAYSRKGLTADESYQLAFIGSVVFVISDSILAINAFRQAIPYAGFFIMATYCAAQLLLVMGILKHSD